MALDPEVCYRAVRSRDPRFDGRIFTAVVTTGIYCRPICPAPAAKRENIRFFEFAAAAERAGFRPCMRCRPEVAPWTPAWNGTCAVVVRALRLIGDGELDSGRLTDLADRLGIGGRQLRRLFDQHVGAPPIAVMQARRVHFARTLIESTSLPVADVAAAAGFRSSRRFRAAMKATYGVPPREIRRRGNAPADGTIRVHLPYRAPYDWAGVLEFLAARAIPGVESVEGGVYRRAVSIHGATGVVRVAHAAGGRLEISLPSHFARTLKPAVDRMRRMFDVSADPEAIAGHLATDPLLRPLVRRHPGVRVPGTWEAFELAVRAVVGQQVSVAGARTTLGRIASAHGTPVENGDGIDRLFPTPAQLADAHLGGMPASRAETVVAVARRFSAGEQSSGELATLRGIGPWTTSYFAMRAENDPDAFPAGDLALRRAAGGLSERQLQSRSEAWRPWRAYAAMLLWRSL